MIVDYPFTAQEMQAASDGWGCNCGPASLAFALQIGLDQVRGVIPGFEDRHYTNPTMMKAAIRSLGKSFDEFPADVANMFRADNTDRLNLVRVQWTGPWTAPGANRKWAYRQSHWIAAWLYRKEAAPIARCRTTRIGCMVFDCNSGITSFKRWEKVTVPTLTALYPRADGGWFPTHVWRVAS